MTGATLVAHCPAKINLGLRVLGRRGDGFHEILTVYQAVGLWDEIEAREDEGIRLETDRADLPTGKDNLVVRAAVALREACGAKRAGVRMHLRKRIPVQGGMGGGSSDAAGALVLLARLWGLEASRDDLAAVAADLGSDVPFFLYGGRAVGTGRGERIEPLSFPGPADLVFGIPPFGVPTGEAYARRAERLTVQGNDVTVSRFRSGKLPGEKDFDLPVNDLEDAVFEAWPGLRTFRDALRREGAHVAMLSGSGSTVYGIFRDPGSAGLARASLAGRFRDWDVRTARTVADAVRVEAR